MKTTDAYLTAQDVADMFPGVSVDQVHKLCREGCWPHLQLARKRYFTREHVTEIERLQERRPNDAPVNQFGQSERSRKAVS